MKNTFLITVFTLFTTILNAQDAKAIFDKATAMVLQTNMELSITVDETDDKGRTKSRTMDVTLADFNTMQKTKLYMKAPERAKGVTIILTKNSDDEGLIEILTPSNGKIRKMKATPENLKMVGSDVSFSSYASHDTNNLTYKLLGSAKVNEKDCYIIEIKEKDNSTKAKAVFYIDKSTNRTLKVEIFGEDGQISNTSLLSDYKPIAGQKEKFQPMKIISTDYINNKKSDITIHSITPKSGLKAEDFTL